jgi:4-amino-4-deoxy-L-arabinose transferase-like glycosyltransferase
MTKNLKLTLLALFIVQLLVASSFELAHDEAYYWLFSRHLDWGYFDHPPFVAVVIKLFSFLPASELSVRLGFILLQFATVLILLSMSGFSWVGVVLFFSFPLASVGGVLALPDMPLLFMTACYFWCLKSYLERDRFTESFILGVCIALLLYAKYHGVLLIFFTLLALPKLVYKKSFYLVTLTSLLCFLPHVWWQYLHDFSTLRYHFFERPSAVFSLARSTEYLIVQIFMAGLFSGPLVWYLLLKTQPQDAFNRVLKYSSIGAVIFFLLSSFSKRIEANWTIFLAPPIILYVVSHDFWSKRWTRRVLFLSFVVVMGARLVFVLPANMVPIQRIKEFKGWGQWAKDIKDECGSEPLLANTYQIASKLSFYLQTEVGALNYHSRKNQFDFWQWDRLMPTEKVCYITDATEFSGKTFRTPEGKSIQIVKNAGLSRLRELKYCLGR